jgi:hypothetical protein
MINGMITWALGVLISSRHSPKGLSQRAERGSLIPCNNAHESRRKHHFSVANQVEGIGNKRELLLKQNAVS